MEAKNTLSNFAMLQNDGYNNDHSERTTEIRFLGQTKKQSTHRPVGTTSTTPEFENAKAPDYNRLVRCYEAAMLLDG